MELKQKIIRITTVASTMNVILKGQLKFVNRSFEVKGITSPDKQYFEEISEREGIRVFPVTINREISILQDLISLFKIICIFRREQPAIVHTQTPKAGMLGMIAAWLTRIPVRMHSVVGIPLFLKSKGIKGYILKQTERITYLFASDIYPNSYGVRKFLLENNLCKPSKIKMIGEGSSNGIDTDFFSKSHFDIKSKNKLKNELNIDDNSLIFCFVGRIVKDKGIHELVTAFLSLIQTKKSEKKLYLIIVGPYRQFDDPVSDEIYEIIRNHRSIKYVGLQRDIRHYLAISDVFVFPSYREGLPGALLQSCSMGLPAIVTDIIGSNEIIIHEENGIIVPPKNSSELENAMQKFCYKPDLILRYGKESRRRISEKYEQKKYWVNLENEYNLLLKKKSIS